MTINGDEPELTVEQHRDVDDDRITMAEAARLKGVSYHTVSRAVRKGTLPVVRLGRMALISARDLKEWQPMRERAPRKYRRRPSGESTDTSIGLLSVGQIDLARRLGALTEMIHSASSESSLEELAHTAVGLVAEAFELTRMVLWRLDDSANMATRLAVYRDLISDYPESLPLDEVGFMMDMVRSGQSQVFGNLREALGVEDQAYSLPDGPVISLPLVRNDHVVGLMFGDRDGEPIDFTEDQLLLADGIASQMAMAIDSAMLRDGERHRRLQLEGILDELTGAVSAFDESGSLTLANAAERQLFDLTDEESRLGQHVREYVRAKRRHTLDGELVSFEDNPATRALRGERLQGVLYQVFDREGNRKLVRTNARPLMVDGSIVGAVCVSNDVTAEAEALERDQDHLRELEHYANRAQSIADLVVEISSSQDTKSVADTALRRIVQELGADVGLLMLREQDGLYHPSAVYGERPERIPASGVNLLQKETTQKAFSLHRPLLVSTGALDMPDSLRDKYGEAGKIMVVPMQIRGNRLGVAYIGFYQDAKVDESDITFASIWGRHCAQAIDKVVLIEQLEFAHGRLMAIIDQLVQGVLILDAPDGTVVMANRAAEQLWGRDIDRDPGVATDLEVVDGEGVPPEPDEHPLTKPIRTGEATVGEPMTVVRPDGERIGVLASHSPLFDVRGEIIGSVSVLQDREDFKPLDRAKDEFISVVAHELRNPLTSLRGNLQLLQRRIRKRGDESASEDLERIESIIVQVDRVSDLVSRMLDVSRVDMGSLDVSVAPTDAAQLVQSVVMESRGMNPSREVVVQGPDSLPVVWDGARVQQVLSNLMQNATRYAPEGPVEVDLSERDPDRVVITVRDHGPGVPRKIKDRLFKQYYRFDDGQDEQTRAADGKRGLGIGLYISARLARAHGGTLAVDDAEGGGAVFTLDLPREAGE